MAGLNMEQANSYVCRTCDGSDCPGGPSYRKFVVGYRPGTEPRPPCGTTIQNKR